MNTGPPMTGLSSGSGLSGGMERASGTPMLRPPTGQSYGGSSQMSAHSRATGEKSMSVGSDQSKQSRVSNTSSIRSQISQEREARGSVEREIEQLRMQLDKSE